MALLIVDKPRGPLDNDLKWQLLLSAKLQALHSPTTVPEIQNGTADGALGFSTDFVTRVSGYDVTAGAATIKWAFSGLDEVPVGESRAYWLCIDADDNPFIFAGQSVAYNDDGILPRSPLELLPELDLLTYGICGVFVVTNGSDFANADMESQGTIYQGIPEGAFIGMESFYYVNSDWVDVHLN